jgi:hypothetical protein
MRGDSRLQRRVDRGNQVAELVCESGNVPRACRSIPITGVSSSSPRCFSFAVVPFWAFAATGCGSPVGAFLIQITVHGASPKRSARPNKNAPIGRIAERQQDCDGHPVMSVSNSRAMSLSTNTMRKKSKASSIQPRKLATTTCFCSVVQPESAAIAIDRSPCGLLMPCLLHRPNGAAPLHSE